MIVGITGTRNDITEEQRKLLQDYLADEGISTIQHGACTGADAEAHMIALDLEKDVIVHPPVDKQYYYEQVESDRDDPRVTVYAARDFLVRNRRIVDTSDVMVALPDSVQRLRSGTWYTIRYTRRMRKPLLLFFPDGRVEFERNDSA